MIPNNWKSIAIAATAAFLGTVSLTANAFNMLQNTSTGRVTSGSLVACEATGGYAHWTTPSISWYVNSSNSSYISAIQAALGTWNAVSRSNMALSYAGTTSAGWSTDGTNSVVWSSGNGCSSDDGCLALTALVLQSGQKIVESDITFNSNWTWSTSGSDYDLQGVATHEFGHTIGIHHTGVTSTTHPTMYATYFGTDMRTLESDDVAAAQCAVTSAVAAPSVSKNVLACNGSYTLDWSAVSGASRYEVWRKATSSASYYSFLSETTGTSAIVNVSSGSVASFKVRSCDASGGCGVYTSPISATYYSGCP